MTFITDLRKLADTLTGDDVPTQSEIQGVVGALVKTLEHTGVTVAEDLFPEVAPEVAAVDEAGGVKADTDVTNALSDLVERAEAALAKFEGHTAPAAPVEPVAPAPAEPVQPVGPEPVS